MSESRAFEPGDVVAMLVNPFYAIEIHPSLARAHEHVLTEAEWVSANERASGELGVTVWLEQLLIALKTDHTRTADPDGRLLVADPYPAITIVRTLCEEHPPLVEEALWVSANARGMEEAPGAWLHNLLTVLKGAYVTGT